MEWVSKVQGDGGKQVNGGGLSVTAQGKESHNDWGHSETRSFRDVLQVLLQTSGL